MIQGAIINKGPGNWQILQQKDGFADIFLSGIYRLQGYFEHCMVYARVVLEDTGEMICNWTECISSCEKVEGDLKEGNWKVLLEKIPTGGLYRIETCVNKANENIEWSSRGDMIHHIGVGDLFVITGQSNSAGYGKDPVNDPPEIGVHVLRNNGKWDIASHPLNESTDSIHEVNTEMVNPGHSPYLNFGKMLKKQLNYPIGLLQASLGGSSLSLWNPEEDGRLYRNMMEIIKSQGGSIRGVLWYQGCSDISDKESRTYFNRFQCMVENLRKDIKNNTLPFLTVQLNRYLIASDDATDRGWGRLREAQRQAAERISYVYVVPANDCTLSDAIHISSVSNMKLGERLARMALTEIYGYNIPCHAPDLKNAFFTGNKITLEFKNVYQKLFAFEMPADKLPFAIEDEAGFIKIMEYEIIGSNKICLITDREISGHAFLHGAYERNPKVFLPVDFATHMSMLSFYGVEIKKDAI